MSTEHEPSRLLEGDDPLEHELRRALRGASKDAPTAAQVDAIVKGTLSSLGTAAGGAGAAASGAKWALLKSGWVELALVVGALGGGGVWWAVEVAGGGSTGPSAGAAVSPGDRPASPASAQPPHGHRGLATEGRERQPGMGARGGPVGQPLRPVVEPLRPGPGSPAAQRGAAASAFPETPPPAPIAAPAPRADVDGVRGERPRRSRSAAEARPGSPQGSGSVGPGRADLATHPHADDPEHDPREETRPSEEPADVRDEVALLSRAQTALAVQPRMALALLARHRREQPRSHLAQERDAMELEALWQLKRRDELREHARAFLRRYPGSPHGKRVSELLDEAAATTP